MSATRVGFALLAYAGLVLPAHAQRTLLVPGMELRYSSNGTAGPPWRVELVERDVTLGGRSGCLRVRFAPGGPRSGPDVRVTCAEDGTLFSWDSTARAWRASRPIQAGRALEVRSGANTSRYTAEREAADTVGTHVLRVIETTVLTRDTTGREIRRLRERYAVDLGTATWGAFEAPDATTPTGWRITQEFRLVAITEPQR